MTRKFWTVVVVLAGSTLAVVVWTLGGSELPAPSLTSLGPYEVARRSVVDGEETVEFNVHRPYAEVVRGPLLRTEYGLNRSPELTSGIEFLPNDRLGPIRMIDIRPGRLLWRRHPPRLPAPDGKGEGWTYLRVAYRAMPGTDARIQRARMGEAVRRLFGMDEAYLADDPVETPRTLSRD